LGVELAAVGDFDGAVTRYQEAAVLWLRVGNTAGTAMSADARAEAARQKGDAALAAQSAYESLALYAELGDPVGIVESLLTVAALVAPSAPAESVVRVLAAADKAREALGLTLYAHGLATVERVIPMLRSRLGEHRFAGAWSAGQQEPLEVVITEALALVSSNEPSPPASNSLRAEGGRVLSSREREVLALLVSGSSDREIADALFISHRTAQGHVARILDKLNVPNRSAAAVVAYRDGLLENEVAPPS
jgi:DNA-binding CsgD family transcriptional regulator